MQQPLERRLSKKEIFEQEVEALLNDELGFKVQDRTKEKLVTLVAMLGSLYGASQREMLGDDTSTDPVYRKGLARMMVECWTPRKNGTGGRGLNPYSVVKAISKASKLCKKFPTEGLIHQLSIGSFVAWWPGDIMYEKERKKNDTTFQEEKKRGIESIRAVIGRHMTSEKGVPF